MLDQGGGKVAAARRWQRRRSSAGFRPAAGCVLVLALESGRLTTLADTDFSSAQEENTQPVQPAEQASPERATEQVQAQEAVYPLISSVLMGGGLLVIGGACYGAGGNLFAADNKDICLLQVGAALEMMALLLVSPTAAFLLAFSLLLLVGFTPFLPSRSPRPGRAVDCMHSPWDDGRV